MPILDFDFVYLPDGKTEFANVHIMLDIIQRDGADFCYELSITSADKISQEDITRIVEELEQKRFKRMNINLAKDCKITVIEKF